MCNSARCPAVSGFESSFSPRALSVHCSLVLTQRVFSAFRRDDVAQGSLCIRNGSQFGAEKSDTLLIYIIWRRSISLVAL
jgi:hypothetical protein